MNQMNDPSQSGAQQLHNSGITAEYAWLRDHLDADLKTMAQGCTELTCPYHGPINAEIQRRANEDGRG